uniref:Uncharacterized protein n=1 Tax=Haemonchus contortus TaxID=6289 RepID=A0A7I4Z6J2_HAECO
MSQSNQSKNIGQEVSFVASNRFFSDLKQNRERSDDDPDNNVISNETRLLTFVSPRPQQNYSNNFATEFAHNSDALSSITPQEEWNYPIPRTADDIYRPTVTLTGNARQSEIMRRRVRRRQLRKAQLVLRDTPLTDQCDRTSYTGPGMPSSQSTQYCDIDANDDATLWMLISLSGKLFRKKSPSGDDRDLRERILIKRVAEKAFNHLFPPIKV